MQKTAMRPPGLRTNHEKSPFQLAFIRQKLPGCLFVVAFLITISVFSDFLDSRAYRLATNVFALPLVAGCDLQIYYKPAQPRTTLTLACPRTDLVRLWPLPVISPWYEESTEMGK